MDLKDSRIESNPMYSFYIDFFKLKAKHLTSSLPLNIINQHYQSTHPIKELN